MIAASRGPMSKNVASSGTAGAPSTAEASVLIPQAEKAGTEFQISERVHSEYVKLAAEYNFLVGRKHAVYPVLSVIEELAQAFPDTTWVQKLDIKVNGKVREVILLGEAQSASRVIENLEQSPLSLFQNSKQQSQTTRTQPNVERFHVSAEIKPRPVPTLEGIDDVIAPTPTAPNNASSALAPIPSPANPAASSNGASLTQNTPTQPATAAIADPAVVKGGVATPTAPQTTLTAPPSAPPSAPPGKRSGT